MVVATQSDTNTTITWKYHDIDTDHSGGISDEEFDKYLAKYGIKPGSAEYDMLVALREEADDGKGGLNAQEFEHFVTALGARSGDHSGEIKGQPSWSIEAMDIDGDGKVSNLEFSAYLKFHGICGEKAVKAWEVFQSAKGQNGGGKYLEEKEVTRFENKNGGDGSFAAAMKEATGCGPDAAPSGPGSQEGQGTGNGQETGNGQNTTNTGTIDVSSIDWEMVAKGGVSGEEMNKILSGLSGSQKALFKQILQAITGGEAPSSDDLRLAATVLNSVDDNGNVDIKALNEALDKLGLDPDTLKFIKTMLSALQETGKDVSPEDLAKFLNLVMYMQSEGQGLTGEELLSKIDSLGLSGPLADALKTSIYMIQPDRTAELGGKGYTLLLNLAPRLVDGTLSSIGLADAIKAAGLQDDPYMQKLQLSFNSYSEGMGGDYVPVTEDVAAALSQGVNYLMTNDADTVSTADKAPLTDEQKQARFKLLGTMIAGIKSAGLTVSPTMSTAVAEIARWMRPNANGSIDTKYLIQIINDSDNIPQEQKDALIAAVKMLDSDGVISVSEMPGVMALATALEDGTLTSAEAEGVAKLIGSHVSELGENGFMAAFKAASGDGGKSVDSKNLYNDNYKNAELFNTNGRKK